jgi:hypothetical protein
MFWRQGKQSLRKCKYHSKFRKRASPEKVYYTDRVCFSGRSEIPCEMPERGTPCKNPAFGVLGLERRQRFADRLLVAVMKELLAALPKDVPSDDYGNAVRRIYNARQREYAKYEFLVPEEGRALKNTLGKTIRQR